MSGHFTPVAVVLLACLAVQPSDGRQSTPPVTTGAPQQQAPPAFRSETTLVPLDVRVVDRQGRPVTDLTEGDFQIFENGVRQRLSHFATQALVANPAAVSLPLLRGEPAKPLAPATRRIFLIVLGRGRLQPPARGVDGMLHFVRSRLLPQDLVAVLAWNRATDFTSDHSTVSALLERFKRRHEKIENDLQMHFSGLAAIYGSRDIPPHIQREIDAVFDAPGAPGVRTVVDPGAPDARRRAADERRALDVLQRAEVTAGREAGSFLPDVETPETLGLDMSLDELAATSVQSNQDLTKIMAGIEFLRYLDGEKHLVFVSEEGLFLPRADDDRGIAARAASARVVIDIVLTGGMPMRSAVGPAFGPATWRRASAQTVSEQTGGTYSSTIDAAQFADRLDDASRFQYVLGYYPSNRTLDRRFRRIAVRVSRPGLRVMYRHGYFAAPETPRADVRTTLSYNRVTAAANLARDVTDIALSVTAVNERVAAGTRHVNVEVKVPPDRLALVEKDGRRYGSLEVAIFCADSRERLVGQSWNTVDVQMTPDAWNRFMASGLTFTGRVAVSAEARFVKVIVYDYAADLLGSMVVRPK